MVKQPQVHTVHLDSVVGGGQTIGTLEDGRKAFVWGGIPGETVEIETNKIKSKFVEGVVTHIITPSDMRIEPLDHTSYLSTSPWQIYDFAAEQHYKAALIEEAFELHDVQLPGRIEMGTDNQLTNYRNKVEFSWYGSDDEKGGSRLDLAFFRRGTRGKIPIDTSSLLPDGMMELALAIRDILQQKGIEARSLKTLLIRANQRGECVWQLYCKDQTVPIDEQEARSLPALGGEVIYSDPRSPASRITKRLAAYGDIVLKDTILGVPFNYATEGFFQVNLPVYEMALREMKTFIPENTSVVDMYSGVGSIGLTIGGNSCTLVEIDENAVREMKRNIESLGRTETSKAVLAPAEKALDFIDSAATIIVDPPRAGLHADVIKRLLEIKPQRIIYLSCNPVTQARDVAMLRASYTITHHKGYNFFPRTPHIEHLVVLDV